MAMRNDDQEMADAVTVNGALPPSINGAQIQEDDSDLDEELAAAQHIWTGALEEYADLTRKRSLAVQRATLRGISRQNHRMSYRVCTWAGGRMDAMMTERAKAAQEAMKAKEDNERVPSAMDTEHADSDVLQEQSSRPHSPALTRYLESGEHSQFPSMREGRSLQESQESSMRSSRHPLDSVAFQRGTKRTHEEMMRAVGAFDNSLHFQHPSHPNVPNLWQDDVPRNEREMEEIDELEEDEPRFNKGKAKGKKPMASLPPGPKQGKGRKTAGTPLGVSEPAAAYAFGLPPGMTHSTTAGPSSVTLVPDQDGMSHLPPYVAASMGIPQMMLGQPFSASALPPHMQFHHARTTSSFGGDSSRASSPSSFDEPLPIIYPTVAPFSTYATQAFGPILPDFKRFDETFYRLPASLVYPASTADPTCLPSPSSAGPVWQTGIPYGQELPPDESMFRPSKSARTAGVAAEKNWKAIEEAERRVWVNIVRKDIPKVQKAQSTFTVTRNQFAKRVAATVAREAKKPFIRTRLGKDVQGKAKRVMREMLIYWKGNEKRERETRKRAEKEALERAKKEEEQREAKRQARKLNFLITQTELYSHFVGNKIKTKEAEESTETAPANEPAASEPSIPESSLNALVDEDRFLEALDFDNDDETNLKLHARQNALDAVNLAKQRAVEFDEAKQSKSGPSEPLEGDQINIDSDELNFQNPSSLSSMDIKQPRMLQCELKEYQLKGLNWLANLYDQGINGILADEMGLGKTVQSISLLAYLAEAHNIWGPFLVIAPASTLHNWQQEIARFVPAFKAIPYWGAAKDRATLRRTWSRREARYDKDSQAHVVVTSYQLVLQDEKYFQGVRWQYMILDEAQAIKSAASARWKTLLGFRCRNRLLLTGTPIQNNMQELWALLHFIMPSLFDSHDEFSEWFSKDIEGNNDSKGGMNERQLRRLHTILKPFMLRRIKRNVQNELGEKTEVDIMCDLTPRQRAMYRQFQQNNLGTLLKKAASSSSDEMARLQNLIMQMRKVCNHPELFERADVSAPLAFAHFSLSSSTTRLSDTRSFPYASHSVLNISLPRLMAGETWRINSDTHHLSRLMSIWTTSNVHNSLKASNSNFNFARLEGLSPAEISKFSSPLSPSGILRFRQWRMSKFASRRTKSISSTRHGGFEIVTPASRVHDLGNSDLVELGSLVKFGQELSYLGRSEAHFYRTPALSPQACLSASDQSFSRHLCALQADPDARTLLYGVSPAAREREEAIAQLEVSMPGLPPEGFFATSPRDQVGFSAMTVPHRMKLVLDSGKLASLDRLLHELKAGSHRVLIYFQMTKMIDIIEEYLSFRQYKYVRLDGSTAISDRRDIVNDWQTRPDIFIFLLSTKAGGLGLNLTSADTVCFYDSDWNPQTDEQAIDRVHRIGQTKPVRVYRLVCSETVESQILRIARRKRELHTLVMGGTTQTAITASNPDQAGELADLLNHGSESEEKERQSAINDATLAALLGPGGSGPMEMNPS